LYYMKIVAALSQWFVSFEWHPRKGKMISIFIFQWPSIFFIYNVVVSTSVYDDISF
jgi:hypothetical protein